MPDPLERQIEQLLDDSQKDYHDRMGSLAPAIMKLLEESGRLRPPNVVELGPHERMTPEQVLAAVAKEDWSDVIVCGFHVGSDDLAVRSSHIPRELSTFIALHLVLYCMGRL